MARVYTKVGDIFCAPLGDGSKKYFQYVAKDLTVLNSSVIRAFRKAYPVEATPDLCDVVRGEVDFYAHVVINWGIQMKLWEKVGTVPFGGELDVFFRSAKDFWVQQEVSSNWEVWRVNQDPTFAGRLEGDYRKAEIGVVVSPPDVVSRMRTGKYKFSYPGF